MVERRLAAILAADVVGYSRLVRADEEGTLSALPGLRAAVIDPAIGAGLFVSAGNSSFACRSKSPGIRDVCRELGVRPIRMRPCAGSIPTGRPR